MESYELWNFLRLLITVNENKNIALHCVKGKYKVNFWILSKCRETQTRKIPNTDTFYAVLVLVNYSSL